MKNLVKVFVVIALLGGVSYAQKRKPAGGTGKASAAPAPKPAVDPGTVDFRTYTNKTFRFSVTFPDDWIIPDKDIEAYVKTQGVDLNPKLPALLLPSTKNQILRNTKNVSILLTVFKKVPGMADNTSIRTSVEDLRTFPQIKDAVDYMDALRITYKAMQLPAGFKYSETQAEKLGRKQFGFLDIETKDDNRRLYATVRNGHALLFSITYTERADLEVLRQILTDGNFALR
jgi:hypothetical protein